jgi:DnaK suppressor protein
LTPVDGATTFTGPSAGRTIMRKREKDKFRNLLLQLRKEITREIQQGVQENREGEAGDGRDTYDIASDERDREISLLLSDRERRKLQQIDDALHRIDTEEYGVCEECGGEIATGRLEAMPFSRLCVTCQSEYEQTQRTVQAEGVVAPTTRYPTAESEDEGS